MSLFPDTSTDFGRRVSRRLSENKVIWLTTISKDGTPQPNPVWFLWADAEILVYNRADANRLGHLRERSRVSLNLDGDGKGGDIVVLAGSAEILQGQPGPHQNPAYVEKYGQDMIRISGSLEQFGAEYPIATRIVIDRVRGH